jgi:hypothetical protein
MEAYLNVDMEIDKTDKGAEQLRAAIRSKERAHKKAAAEAQAATETTRRNQDIIEGHATTARDEAFRNGATEEEAATAYFQKAEEVKRVVEDATRPKAPSASRPS